VLDTLPGVSQQIAQLVLAQLGAALSRFPSARHLTSWAGVCPGNHASAGNRFSGKTRKGTPFLRNALQQLSTWLN
jgi:transposase